MLLIYLPIDMHRFGYSTLASILDDVLPHNFIYQVPVPNLGRNDVMMTSQLTRSPLFPFSPMAPGTPDRPCI